MGRMTYVCGVTEDRQSVVLEMHEDGKLLAHMLFDGASTELLIENLAKARSALLEEVPQMLDPGARLTPLVSPAWRVPDTHTGPSGTVLLALRHPGLGWVSFLLEEARSREIGQALVDTAPTKPK